MTLDEYLDAYDRDHAHPLNRMLHVVGITLIGSSVALVVVVPPLGVTLFTLGWACQLIGHAVEGKPPSFARDIRYMAVGAVWYRDRVRELGRKLLRRPETHAR